MRVLITGTAGFIGFHLVKRLVSENFSIVGIDSINDYYDVKLKFDRLSQCGIPKHLIEYNKAIESQIFNNYTFIQLNLEDTESLQSVFNTYEFDYVINLAAQAGVRYSLINPNAYIKSNIDGFLNILECCRNFCIKHLIYASSSSVYGLNQRYPFSTHHNVDHPISLYAASKKANELMAHTYSYLYGIPTTGLRFFTVYGPWGRPDMALFLFTKAILEGKEIEVFNHGEMERDFTYIDDIIEGIFRLILHFPEPNKSWTGLNPDPASSMAPYRIYNIGNSQPVKLMDFIDAIQNELNIEAKLIFKPLQPGDVLKTWADTNDLFREIGYKPYTPVSEGVKKFIQWYKSYYQIH